MWPTSSGGVAPGAGPYDTRGDAAHTQWGLPSGVSMEVRTASRLAFESNLRVDVAPYPRGRLRIGWGEAGIWCGRSGMWGIR